ncbi:hypothetical protein [Ktedonospora formicarum]|uniref:Uncharacterized protein n=1 Tax=Ktedonospora formicarum TaxID=2778364 RepID=A0A8J3MTI8_9CHLR|nr:hypothetical protein [Ktedonospora formicarum]GHO44420.1 hypothetical protein KSX_25830 [Ktedonospora formicarum]
MASSPASQKQVFIGPGLSRFKLVVTILGLIAITGLVLWIAIHQGASVIVSTILAILFILGFAGYLRIVAPIPFTIALEPNALVKHNKGGEDIVIPWENLIKIREEFFPNGKRIAVLAYRKVTEPGQKPKAWAVYRDDVNDLDALAEALKNARPETCEWESEIVHE